MAELRSFLILMTSRLAAAGVDSPRLSAEILLAFAMGLERADLVKELLVNPDRAIPDGCLSDAEALLRRREKGEPAAYLVGVKEFYGRNFIVTPETLIPRPDTETLVGAALDFVKKHIVYSGPCSFIDLGTGSGAVAVTLALELPAWEGFAVDISSAALDIARQNAKELGPANLTFSLCDFLSADLPGAPFDMIVANPPYVSEEEYLTLSHEVREFEPRSALVPDAPGSSGLEYLLAIMDSGPVFLKPGGMLLMEMGCTQGEALLNYAAASKTPWENTHILPDLAGLPRVFAARLNSA